MLLLVRICIFSQFHTEEKAQFSSFREFLMFTACFSISELFLDQL